MTDVRSSSSISVNLGEVRKSHPYSDFMILGGEDDKPYAVDELEKILAADDAELRDANFISLLFLIPDFSKALRRDIQEIGESYKAEIGSIAFDVCSRTEIVVCYRLIRDFEYPIGS